MNILAVDDEPLMLWQLTENLKRIFEKPEYRVSGFDEVDDVMEWLDAQEKGSIAYAFLDIKLRGMSGIELAKDIRERSPETKVIFCTAYSDYAMEAFSVHAVGYLLKPVSEGDIRDVLRQLQSARSLCARLGDSVKERALADIGQADNSEFHSFRILS